jgi:NADPH-dependent ferric siderophore reductase
MIGARTAANATPGEEIDLVAAGAEHALAHLNGDHPDSLLLVGRILGGRRDATTAQAVGVDRFGLDVVLDGPDGTTTARIGFAGEATDLGQLQVEALSLVLLARERSGEDGLTSAEVLVARMRTIPTFVTRVLRTEQLSPGMRQITVGGGDLADFTPIAPDQFVYVLSPPAGRTELTIGRDFSWEAYQHMDVAERPVGAYYTVRRWRPEVHEIDLVVVLHGDEGEGSAWARRAQPGDPVALWGPRQAFEPPTDTDWYLLVGDETGLPAMAAILEALPADTVVLAVIEVADAGEHLPLPESPSVRVDWLHRDGAAPGTSTALVDAVRALELPPGTGYAWGGGESHVMTAVRRFLRRELGMAREAVSMLAYWRLATDDHDDHDTDQDDGDDAA